ncbi:hypothetical protein DL93DRAFT_1489809 [Clavulina sp. PMI_390]|nr:hypothetical protein DL93DRAFT_1489809 [Clavulina sp. PMI_390]
MTPIQAGCLGGWTHWQLRLRDTAPRLFPQYKSSAQPTIVPHRVRLRKTPRHVQVRSSALTRILKLRVARLVNHRLPPSPRVIVPMSVPKRSSLLAKPMTLATMLVESSSGSRSSSPSASSNGAAKPQQQKKPKPPRPDLPSFSWNTRESEDEPLRTLHYITSLPDAEYFLSQVTGDVVGFDVEWKPNFVKGQAENRIALAQVADRSAIYLVHISLMGWKVPPRLRLILEDGTIRKAGVGIDGDKDKIRRDLGVNLAGPLELSTLAREVDPSAWTEHNAQKPATGKLGAIPLPTHAKLCCE